MLYLEDCVEMIEHVPQDVRDRLTEVRELDLQVQNVIDGIQARSNEFFDSMAKSKESMADAGEKDYQSICAEYAKAFEHTNEKINIATQMEEQMQKHLRKIENELNKFKYELEADHPGITDQLEERSKQLDSAESSEKTTSSGRASTSKNSRRSATTTSQADSSASLLYSMTPTPLNRSGLASDSSFFGGSMMSPPPGMLANSPGVFTPDHTMFRDPAVAFSSTPRAGSSKNRQHNMSTPSATGLTGHGGRRQSSTSTIVSSGTASVPVGSSLTAPDSKVDVLSAAVASGTVHLKKHKSKKRPKSHSLSTSLAGMSMSPLATNALPSLDTAMASPGQVQQQQMAAASSSEAWNSMAVESNIDPNEAEKRYCLCDQVSYGEMIACDNTSCSIEWFHYPCVGLDHEPEGKWYCPNCLPLVTTKHKKKHHRSSLV